MLLACWEGLPRDLDDAVGALRAVDSDHAVVHWWDTVGRVSRYVLDAASIPIAHQDVLCHNLGFYRNALLAAVNQPAPEPEELANLITLLVAVVQEWQDRYGSSLSVESPPNAWAFAGWAEGV